MNHLQNTNENCILCHRYLPTTFHHLIPRSTQKRKRIVNKHDKESLSKGIWICRSCHSAIHRFCTNMELACDYFTTESLVKHPQISSYLEWAKKQKKLRIRTNTMPKHNKS